MCPHRRPIEPESAFSPNPRWSLSTFWWEAPTTHHSQCSGCWYSRMTCWKGTALVEFSSKQWKLSIKFKLNYTIQNIYQNDIIREKLCAPHMSIRDWKEVVSWRIPSLFLDFQPPCTWNWCSPDLHHCRHKLSALPDHFLICQKLQEQPKFWDPTEVDK